MMRSQHMPVMLIEVIGAIAPKAGAVYADATFGRGGYTKAVLEAADCHVIAIDRDPDAAVEGQAMARLFSGRLTFLSGRFSEITTLSANAGFSKLDGIMFDLGLSSPQIDNAERGFSFQKDGPLDMRMDKSGKDAGVLINTATESDLADILHYYGEEKAARRIAKAIIKIREQTPITGTAQLADIIRSVLPRPKTGQIDPATRSFQAIRIHVNNELEEIKMGLSAAEQCLKPGGVLAVVSFHSLEDRIIKQFLIKRSGNAPRPSRHLPDTATPINPSFKLLPQRPQVPSDAEIAVNPRARSAKLRVAVRTDAPPIEEAA